MPSDDVHKQLFYTNVWEKTAPVAEHIGADRWHRWHQQTRCCDKCGEPIVNDQYHLIGKPTFWENLQSYFVTILPSRYEYVCKKCYAAEKIC